MTNTNARIHISLKVGTIEIEGTEGFVTEQLNRFESYITSALDDHHKGDAKKPKSKPIDASETNALSAASRHSNLFAVADGKIQILKDLPGDGKAQKTVSAAMLLTYANGLMGNEATTYDIIREVFYAHACLDGTNFSKTLKAEKELFIIGGTAKRQTVTLTVPGKRKAEELAHRLNDERS
jgi:hypothetical protein